MFFSIFVYIIASLVKIYNKTRHLLYLLQQLQLVFYRNTDLNMSTFLWQLARAKELRERRKQQNKCDRYGFYYFKTLEKCPQCSELPDYKVKLLIKQRKKGVYIGKIMLIGMLAILLFLYISNT